MTTARDFSPIHPVKASVGTGWKGDWNHRTHRALTAPR